MLAVERLLLAKGQRSAFKAALVPGMEKPQGVEGPGAK